MSKSIYSPYFRIEKRLHASGVHVERHELIADFTDDRKTSLKELTAWEFNEFLNWLNRTYPTREDAVKNNLNLQRRKIIALFRKMGWIEKGKADMERIYAWTLQYGYLKKPLNDYTSAEVPKLVSQVEIIYKKFIEDQTL